MLLLAACSLAADPSAPPKACPLADSGTWFAGVDAMPGPRAPRLIVTGKIRLPRGAAAPRLELGPVQEIDPPVQQVNLVIDAPAGRAATGAIEEREVRGEFKALDRYGGVTIHCGGQLIAHIGDVGRAY